MNKDIEIKPDMNLGVYSPLELTEKAASKSQQRFFGIVDAYKKGELDSDEVSKSVKDAAKDMSMKQVKDFAKTKHKGLPNHVDESILRKIIREALEQTWADAKPENEMDKIRLQRYQGLVDVVEYYLNQFEKNPSFNLSGRQREDLESACNQLQVFGEIGEKWANLGRNMLNGNKDAAEEKSFTDENVYTMDDWKRDGTLKVQIGQLIAPEVYWQLRDCMPPTSDGTYFQPGEAYDHDWKTGKELYQTFVREEPNVYRYKGLQPIKRWSGSYLSESLNELSDDTRDNAYMKAMKDVNTLPYGTPEYVRRKAQANNIKNLRDEKLGFDPTDMSVQMKQRGTSGNPTIDRRWATWQRNHNDRVSGKRTYDKKTGKWKTQMSEEELRELVKESVQNQLVKILGKYAQGKASSEQANKAIMDLANSSNNKSKLSERNNRSFYDYADEYMKKNGEKLPDDVLKKAEKKNDERFHNRKK